MGEWCLLAHDDVDPVPEGQRDDVHPGVGHHHPVELPDGVRHLVLHTTSLVDPALLRSKARKPDDCDLQGRPRWVRARWTVGDLPSPIPTPSTLTQVEGVRKALGL